MARKRKNLKKLNYNSAEYWNRLLTEEGLALDRGKTNKLLYIGGSNEVEALYGYLRTYNGQTRPKGTGDLSQDDPRD